MLTSMVSQMSQLNSAYPDDGTAVIRQNAGQNCISGADALIDSSMGGPVYKTPTGANTTAIG